MSDLRPRRIASPADTSRVDLISRADLENARLTLCLVGAAAGLLLGWALPESTWRSAVGATTLGDVALFAAVGLGLYFAADLLPRHAVAVTTTGGLLTLLVRELAWRFAPTALTMLYAASATALVCGVFGSFVYEVRRGRPVRELLRPERLVVLLVAMQVLGWTVFAAITS